MSYKGKVALVTGGARGIGASIAARLAEAGAFVTVIDSEGATDDQPTYASGGTIQQIQGSVTDRRFLESTVEAVVAERGSIHILVNNAGIIRDGFLSQISEDDWDAVMAVNLKGPFLCCQSVAPAMKKAGYGKIVNIVSRSWLGNIGQANYAASKGGLVSLTRTLALELAKWNINVNAVAPGLIDTPMTRALKPEVRERLIATQPLHRVGTPEEIAAAVAFLCGDDAAFITGQVLHVDGGKSCGLVSL